MARQFNTEVEALLGGYREPDLTEINGEKVTTIERSLELNSDGKYEWYSEVHTWVTSYLCTEDGEILYELGIDDSDGWEDDSDIGCGDCPEDECNGHCMSCAYRSV